MTLQPVTTSARVKPCPVPLVLVSEMPHADRRVDDGTMTRVRRGVYTTTAQWGALKPWDRYLARIHAVALQHPSAVFCHESAAALLGLPIFGDPVTVHLVDTLEATSRAYGGIRVHTTQDDREIVDIGGLLVTSRSATVVDLARSRHEAIGLSVANAALRADASLTMQQLTAENEGRATSRGRRHARWPLQRASPAPETPLESVSLVLIEWLGYPEPEMQVTFRSDGYVDRVDFWWPHVRVAGEADGDIKYDGSLSDPLAQIRAEKHRDRRLRRSASGIAHWGWREVGTVAPVRESLTQAGLHPIRPEQPARLLGLTALLHPSSAHQRETAAGHRNSGLSLQSR